MLTLEAVKAVPGEKVSLTYGEKLRVNVSLGYKGPKIDATLYGAIGVKGATFNEKVKGDVAVSFPKSDTFVPWTGSVEVPITSEIRPGTDYDIYCKIKEYPGAGMPEALNAVDIIGTPPTYKLVYAYKHPLMKTYFGKAQNCVAEFLVPLPSISFLDNILVDKINDAFMSEVEKQGEKVLEIKIYEDATPLWVTYYRVEFSTTLSAPLTALGFVALWPAVLIIVLIIAVLGIIGFVVLPQARDFVATVTEFFQKAPVAAVGMTLAIIAIIGVGAFVLLKKKK